MSEQNRFYIRIDWITVIYFLILVTMGWLSVYGASYELGYEGSIFDFDQRSGKQFIWILTAFGISGLILLLDHRIFNYFAYIIYAGTIILLIITIFVAPEIKGSRSWLVFGPVSLQPAELAKMATALALAKYMSKYNFSIQKWNDLIIPGLILFLPFALIVLQKETGSALVFAAFLLVLYREGMKGSVLLLLTLAVILFIVVIRFSIIPISEERGTWGIVIAMGIMIVIQFFYAMFFNRHRTEAFILLGGTAFLSLVTYILNKWFVLNYDYIAMVIVGISAIYWLSIEFTKRHKKYVSIALISILAIGFSYSADFMFNKILEPHQQIRIKVLLNMEHDPTGAGYNVNQSKIAIGSGGFWGKGFLNGTQTKLKYVPEQDTDFIFCTVGEEHGFVGSIFVLIVYWLLLMRILRIAERQREDFHRIYAYGIASVLFFHLMINVGMVLGLMPVIGIPLPFFSYGGSSLWSFTLMLFILLKMDASRLER